MVSISVFCLLLYFHSNLMFLDVKGISQHARSVGDSILEGISDEIHHFYTSEFLHKLCLKINYASRHAKLLRLIPIAEVNR